MKNKGLYIESIGVTILTLLVILVLYMLSFNMNIFNVLKKSYNKIDLYDLYYSQLKAYDADISNDIVLVNIGNHSRKEIAKIIDRVNANNPKVVGLDVFFTNFNNSAEDTLLLKSLHALKDKLVLAYDITSPETNMNKAFQLEDVNKGYSNFIGNKNGAPIRNVQLTYEYDDKIQYSFAYSISKMYDSELTNIIDNDRSVKDGQSPTIINYNGGYDRFYPIEGSHIINQSGKLNKIKNKIVIIGYFGTTFNSLESNNDRHFTPMNNDGGHGIPDMHGALIHANIVQMMIDKNYVTYWPKNNLMINILSPILAFPFIVLFTYYFVRRHLWYHIIAKITQLALGILLIFIVLNFYDVFYVKLEIKFFLLILAISVDVLYLYEAIAALIYKKYGKKSYFIHSH